MNIEKKQPYMQPALVKHALLRDITANASGKGNCGFGNGGFDGVPGNSGCQDVTR
ncbi:MAG TPA: hypothetical protein VF205_01090 [Nitrospiraceae bacterium]